MTAAALLLPLAAETVDAAEEGKKVIIAMLIVGLVFVSIVVLGELAHWRHYRRRQRSA